HRRHPPQSAAIRSTCLSPRVLPPRRSTQGARRPSRARRKREARYARSPPRWRSGGPRAAGRSSQRRATRALASRTAATQTGRCSLKGLLRAIEAADPLNDTADEITLGIRQKRIPDIEDQDGPGCGALVPCLVLDRVIEHPGLAEAPLTGAGAHTEAASRRN